MGAIATLALVVLVACGQPSAPEAHDVTRVPVMSDAAAQATREAESGATPAVAEAPAEEAAPAEETTAPAAEEPAAAAAEPVTVVSHDIYFEPTEITIPANTDVTFSLPNEGVTLHDFSIDELGINVEIAPGATEEVVINAPAGTYEIYCSVPGHKQAGMVATLTVTEDAAAAPAAAEAEPAAAEPAEAPPAEEEAAPAAAEEAPAEEAAPAAAAEPVTVTSFDIYFEPTEITIPANTDVTFVLPNEGVTLHDFAIDELGIKVEIAPGETEEVVVNAPAGTYEFYCSVPGHKAAGMFGTLTVTEDAAAAPAAAADEAAPAAEAEPAEQEAQPAAEQAPAEAAAPAVSAEPVTVTSFDIYFEPTEITIPANTDVTFTLPNEGVTLHDFAIDELGIKVEIAPGDTEEVVINAPAGTYEFYCSVPGHKAAGMFGTLTVVEGAAAAPPAEDAQAAEDAAPAEQDAEAAAPAAAESAATPAAASAGPIQLIADDIFFDPEEITIPADTDVTITVLNDGVAAHTFTIDALDISVPIAPGESADVVINAPAGEYEYYCTEPGHRDIGMAGTLIVTGDGAAPAPAEAAQEATPVAAQDAAPAVSADPVTVTSFDIYFEPTEITIPANTDVPFILPNEGVTLHDFAIDELGIKVEIAPGATEEIVINAPAGTYEVYCSVPGHKEAGMVATLTVTDDGAAAPAETAQEAAPAETADEAAAAEPAAADADDAAAPAAAAGPVEVVSYDIYFEPTEITIPADTDVTFTLPNEGVTLHDFAIDELGIKVEIAPGDTEEVVINAPAGTYEYYCSVPGHKQAGMFGTLTVE